MIRAIVGVPGAGKTYMGMNVHLRELLLTKRKIVTTLEEIDVPRFQEWLCEKYPKEGIELSQRLFIIPKKAASEWYRYRGDFTLPPCPHGGCKPKGMSQSEWDAIIESYFAGVNERNPAGVCYYIGEAHRFFRAADWATFADVAMFYLSQHRHLNDTFWFETQNPEQVIPALRRQAQDCLVMRNHYVESFLIWKKPGGLYWRAYNYVPETKDRLSEPYDQGTLVLDKKGLGSCYKTRGALGGEVRIAEDKPPSKKLPFWSIFIFAGVGACLVVAALWFFPKLVVGGISSMIGAGQRGMAAGMGVAASPLPAAPVSAVPPGQKPDIPGSVPVPSLSAAQSVPASVKPPLQVKFYLVSGRSYRVGLSDGRVLTAASGEVARIDESGVLLVSGERIPFAPYVPSPRTSPVPASPRVERVAAAVPAQATGSERAPLGGGEREGAQAVEVSSGVPRAREDAASSVSSSAPSKRFGSGRIQKTDTPSRPLPARPKLTVTREPL